VLASEYCKDRPRSLHTNQREFRRAVALPLEQTHAFGFRNINWCCACRHLKGGVCRTDPIAGISKDPLASKGLLRHTSLATTERHYIKDVPENTLNAMNRLEQLFNNFNGEELERRKCY
jgi:integrase